MDCHSSRITPSRDTYEQPGLPSPQTSRLSWKLRSCLWGAIVLAIITCFALWRNYLPRVADPLTWEQIAPPPTQSLHPWKWILIHHSATNAGDSQSFDASHVHDRGWDGIGYHFVIGNGRHMPLGRIDATFRWLHQMHGAHAGVDAYNQEGIGICLVGDFNRDAPDIFQEQRLVELCVMLLKHIPSLSINAIIGHRDVPGKATACPGQYLNMDGLRQRIQAALTKQQESHGHNSRNERTQE